MTKALLIVTLIASILPTIAHGETPTLAVVWDSKTDLSLNECINKTKNILDENGFEVFQDKQIHYWAKDEPYIVSITCMTNKQTLFIVVAGPNGSENKCKEIAGRLMKQITKK
jgi:hypothetical protein